MQVRGLGTIVTANRTKSSPTTATTNGLGNGDTPRVSGSIEANYVKGPIGLRLSQRYTGKTRRTITGIDENYPIGPNVAYTDANISYKFDNQELFLNVQNLFDTQPPIVADGANPGLQFPTNRGRYDVIGRYVTLGLRFKL